MKRLGSAAYELMQPVSGSRAHVAPFPSGQSQPVLLRFMQGESHRDRGFHFHGLAIQQCGLKNPLLDSGDGCKRKRTIAGEDG